MFGLDPVADAGPYASFLAAVDEAGADATLGATLAALDRGGSESRAVATRLRNLGVDRWAIWAEHGELPVGDRLAGDWRAAVFDLGGVGSSRERAVVSAAVLGALWDRRHDRAARLVVIDEAHNVCPAQLRTDAEAVAADLVVRIAAEGREYGLYLALSTQEPHKVHPDALSQCANLILMRTTSTAALDQLAGVFSDVPAGLLRLAPEFGLGQGVVAGRIARIP